MQDTPCVQDDCRRSERPGNPAAGLLGINYPASFWPIPLPGWCPNLSCDTVRRFGLKGVHKPRHCAAGSTDTRLEGKIVIAGYSQGARVVSIAKIAVSPTANGQICSNRSRTRNEVSFVFIGNPNRPNGGLLSRLGFLGRHPDPECDDRPADAHQHRNPHRRLGDPVGGHRRLAHVSAQSTGRGQLDPRLRITTTAPTWRSTRTSIPVKLPPDTRVDEWRDITAQPSEPSPNRRHSAVRRYHLLHDHPEDPAARAATAPHPVDRQADRGPSSSPRCA